MRIWDLAAGYLNRGSLLGEHRELHGIHSILMNGKTGYARHPETRRWATAVSGLSVRHRQLVAEMRLRGYTDRTPLMCNVSGARRPRSFVTPPEEQVILLRKKYVGKEKGRIPLPRNAQELWAQHKYSVMARSPRTYQALGRAVARMRDTSTYSTLLEDLTSILRDTPTKGRLLNAIEHMWGYVRDHATAEDISNARTSTAHLLVRTQRLALQHRQRFLLSSTALSELAVFVEGPPMTPDPLTKFVREMR
jgi:Pyrimidine dimer DNA glycosylase/Protein of unknown function (DUF1722)